MLLKEAKAGLRDESEFKIVRFIFPAGEVCPLFILFSIQRNKHAYMYMFKYKRI